MASRLINFIITEIKNKEPTYNQIKIYQISISMSGKVDSNSGVIIKSFALDGLCKKECSYENFPFVENIKKELKTIQPDVNTIVTMVNDGIATAIGVLDICKQNGYKFPVLTLTLGTGPAISVVHVKNDQNFLYTGEDWIEQVNINGKLESIYNALKAKTIKDNINKPYHVKIYSKRVGTVLKQIISVYKSQIDSLPYYIFLAGGLANILKDNAVYLGSEVPIYILKKDEQRQIQLKGAAYFYKIKDNSQFLSLKLEENRRQLIF